jgi:serine/threonine protein kinase
MPTTPAPDQIKDCLVQAGIAEESLLDGVYKGLLSTGSSLDSKQILAELRARGTLTSFQAEEITAGRGRNLRLGNYLLLDRIGQGGMGTVYKAWHVRMCRVVAIKVLGTERSHTADFASRFQREVQAISRLNHPNIVSAYDADDSPIGSYLVMEYVRGADLGQVVERSGPLGLEETMAAVRQVVEALEFAHAHGVVHRDIKPGNLLRDTSGVVKVADLGLARLEADDLGAEGGAAYTRSSAIAGTIDYMAPEQAVNARDVDHRADIYSLGCTLFYLLTGRPVFVGRTIAA